MIRPSSIALAEAIAVGVNTDTAIEVKPLLVGLNELSHGSAMYREDFREEIVKVTSDITSHSAVLDATSTKLAESLRGGLDMISTYGVPFAKKLSQELMLMYTPDRLQQIVFSQLEYSFINVDDPFFDSPMFPTEVKNTSLSYTGVSLAALRRLEFNWPSEEQVLEYVNSNHPDVAEIIQDTEYELGRAGCTLFDEAELGRMFAHNNFAFDFTKVKSLEINRLLKMYVILSKMYGSDEPVSWLVKGSLDDYREFVNLLWNGMTRYLIGLKEVAAIYKARTVALAESKTITLGAHPSPDFSDARFLQGGVVIYYTDKAMDLLEKGGVSFSEWLIALLWARVNQTDLNMVELLSDKATVDKWAGAYFMAVNTALKGKAQSVFIKTASDAANHFVATNPLLAERVSELCDKNMLAENWFRSAMNLEYEKAYHTVSECLGKYNSMEPVSESDSNRVLTALLSSNLVPSFLRAIKCDTAAAIIEATYVVGETADTAERQRERLHEALIKVIINHSFEGR